MLSFPNVGFGRVNSIKHHTSQGCGVSSLLGRCALFHYVSLKAEPHSFFIIVINLMGSRGSYDEAEGNDLCHRACRIKRKGS